MTILKNPTCVCETRTKLESACRDLLRERDEAKADADKYYQLWQSVIQHHEDKTVQERDRLLVLATKHCDKEHPDWQEILRIAGCAC